MNDRLAQQLHSLLVVDLQKQATKPPTTWWHTLRQEATTHFIQQKLPTQKGEHYRYTPLNTRLYKPLTDATLPLAGSSTPPNWLATHLPGHHIKLHNGAWHTCDTLGTLPAAITIKPLSKASKSEQTWLREHFGAETTKSSDPFVTLNTASCQEGILITLAPNHTIDLPIYLHNHTDRREATIVQPRVFLHIGAQSKAHIIHIPYSNSALPLFVNQVQEFVLGRGAHLAYYHLALAPMPHTQRFDHTYITQASDSLFEGYNLTLASSFIRNHFSIKLTEERAKAKLYGSYLGQGEAHIENNLQLMHLARDTQSHTRYKGVVRDNSNAVFHGILNVNRMAQKTAASQYHHGWILDDTANLYARPSLAIKADDVICQHGATMAKPRDEELFYLRTRGIPAQHAYKMLLEAFLQETVMHISLPSLGDYLQEAISKVCMDSCI